jgi:hypothetical protein
MTRSVKCPMSVPVAGQRGGLWGWVPVDLLPVAGIVRRSSDIVA